MSMRSRIPGRWSIFAISTSLPVESSPRSRPAAHCRPMMNLRASYLQQLAERGFQPDPVQAAVVTRLEGLRARLIAAREAESSRVKRWLGALGGKSNAAPVRGLY